MIDAIVLTHPENIISEGFRRVGRQIQNKRPNARMDAGPGRAADLGRQMLRPETVVFVLFSEQVGSRPL